MNVGDCDGPMFATLFVSFIMTLSGPQAPYLGGAVQQKVTDTTPPIFTSWMVDIIWAGWAATISSGCVHVRDHFDSLLCVYCAAFKRV